MGAEMRYYGIPDPYGRTECWYERVILPALKGHNHEHLVSNRALNMSELWDVLLETQAPSINALPGPYRSFSRDIDTSGEDEKYEVGFEEESDSYDEVDEENAMDDTLKTLED
ncbi:hypothetical protein BBP40_004292 [Aspergillus hancockii]|nr:hypothetical protein BBP40_004292 [Aspergillus hancockii]